MVNKSNLILFSRIVSYVFEPIFIYFIAMGYHLFIRAKIDLFSYEFFLYFVLPVLLSILFLKIYGVKKIDLSNYALRKKLVFKIYPIFVAVMLISIFLIKDLKTHIFLTLCMSLWVISLLYTKTSAHVYFFVTLPSIINLDVGLVSLILIASTFIAYARYQLNKHTLRDLSAAYFFSILYYISYFILV
ncbi:MAG: hypothetical protein N3A71_00835 [Candidatus Dojkabacteria bacterium]|nr:hypothetical protein [Candidatus Dojkabacteria bacterium]